MHKVAIVPLDKAEVNMAFRDVVREADELIRVEALIYRVNADTINSEDYYYYLLDMDNETILQAPVFGLT